MRKVIQQHVLLATDRHDAANEPEEQWLTIQSAGAFLLSQWLPDTPPPKESGSYHMSKKEYDKFRDLLWKFTRAIGWSKWDDRSEWYIKQVLPLGQEAPEVEPPSLEFIESRERELLGVMRLLGNNISAERRAQCEMYLRQMTKAKEKRKELDSVAKPIPVNDEGKQGGAA